MINREVEKRANEINKPSVQEESKKAECPYCKLNVTISLDPKQISDKKSLQLCLVCGQVFEYINPDS